MSAQLETDLRHIFGELFPIDPAELDDDSRRGEIDGWDSLGHLDLVSALEGCFAVRIEAEKALEIETFADAKRVLAQLLSDG